MNKGIIEKLNVLHTLLLEALLKFKEVNDTLMRIDFKLQSAHWYSHGDF